MAMTVNIESNTFTVLVMYSPHTAGSFDQQDAPITSFTKLNYYNTELKQ
ncbi:MAG: hypothetical protein K9K84_00040 [Methylovulum sp.]|nr:hypothetical protein [Methylovulum sp.]